MIETFRNISTLITITCFNSFRNGTFEIFQLYRQTRFTNKLQTKAYTLDDLVGTCGGYIGMFLGYAFIQFPRFLELTFLIIKQKLAASYDNKVNGKDMK